MILAETKKETLTQASLENREDADARDESEDETRHNLEQEKKEAEEYNLSAD